jgi:hypothetical protein
VLAAPETRADGESILTALYGAPDPAMAAAGRAGPMAPLIAALTLAAIARRGQATMLGIANAPDRGSGGGGIIGTILAALLAGLVKGLMQALQRRTSAYGRRRATYGRVRTRTASTRRRRGQQPSLDDIFGEILRRR